MTQPRQLDAAEQPCQLRKSHNPTPVRTQSHHRYPEYLQRRLWGETRLQDRIALCGTDHDSIHTWISFLLGEQARPQLDPGVLVKNEAAAVVLWYEKLKAGSGFGEGRFGSGAFGDGQGDPSAIWDGIE